MLHPSYSDLMKVVNSEVEPGESKVVNSRYSIVMATSKRARQLIDGPYIESKRDISLPYMGSSNQRVIGCNKSFALRRPVLWWAPEKKGK